ncbi:MULTISPECIES: hypothetical protein [Nocardioides]|uniref:Uncharacterized protein n=1 Tax=Nocardioides vastitatis TaxID=2568655 RepID=A0ABW0ZJA4_9ACTN|nr:hypothetical protein [Nocardioides sp.]THJ09194.1 hypothetical protein E7Z54_03405 [Nocardioides sp.]
MKAEERLSDTLHSLARGVDPTPDPYDRLHATWRRRERRRRAVAALLAVAVIGGADAAALWALSSGDPKAHLLEDPPPQRVEIER